MATLSVAAIVVSHGKEELLARSLQALAEQTHPIEQVVVVETASDQTCVSLAQSFGFATITPGPISLGQSIDAGVAALANIPGWIWIIHDDSVCEPGALSAMARAAEISPSVAVIGPKLLELENPIQIQQMGLTATRSGRPFQLVRREYDQGQHDKTTETLAVSTAAMLVSMSVWQQLGGLDETSPTLAQDLEFGVKARAAGYRVVVEAGARVSHAGLSMQGKRSKKWLGGSVATALSKAHVHMLTLFAPLPLALLVYLAMPLYVLAWVPLNLVAKRPGRIFAQAKAWLWSWFTIRARLSARARLRAIGPISSLRPLMATRKQLRLRRRSRFEAEPEIALADQPAGFFRSNSSWFTLLPLIFSFNLFPVGALLSDRIAPLGATFAEVFSSVATTNLQVLNGVSAPSDPFGWILLLGAALWPSSPSIGFAALVFLSPTLAFLGAWQLGKLFITKPWLVTLSSLAYAFSPQLLQQMRALNVVELLAAAFFPWAAYFLVRAATAYNSARAWRWVGLAGLSLVAIAVTSPVLFAVLALSILVFGSFTFRRLLILIWSVVPALLILYPWASFLIQAQLYPALTTASAAASAPTLGMTDFVVVGALGLIASLAWIFAPAKKLLVPAFFGLVALGAAWYQPVASSQPLILGGSLALLIVIGVLLEQVSRPVWSSIIVLAYLSAVASSALLFSPFASNEIEFAEPRVMPALVVAASTQDENVRTLKIEISQEIQATYLWGSGATFERKSALVGYVAKDGEFETLVANATANLLAGNSKDFDSDLSDLRIDFVLLANKDLAAEVAISSISSLQPAGQTEFGTLWQVQDGSRAEVAVVSEDSLKNWQLGALAAFALLAIPTRASIRGYRRVRGER